MRGQSDNYCVNRFDNEFQFTGLRKDFFIYHMNKRNDRKIKLTSRRLEANAQLFDGSLEGVPITAALNWTQSGKELVYFFAGRHLCKQEINETDWVPMCDITDIADWVKCSDENGFPLIFVIVLVLALVVVMIVLIVVLLWLYKSYEKPKSEPKAQPNAKNAS